MRIQHALMTVVALALALLTVTGTFLTEHYPQAAEAHSVGFDALAHSLFDDATAASSRGVKAR